MSTAEDYVSCRDLDPEYEFKNCGREYACCWADFRDTNNICPFLFGLIIDSDEE